MSMYKLISATPSPYARKVRIALQEKNIPFDLITKVPWDSTTQTPQWNPLEKLPVLIPTSTSTTTTTTSTSTSTTNGDASPTNDHASAQECLPKAIYESHHILSYLEAKHPSPPLLPPDADIDARLFARQVEVVCDGMCDALVLRLFELRREPSAQSKEWLARQMRKVDGGMRQLDEWAREAAGAGEGSFLVGGQFGLADVAVGAVCGYLDVRFAEYPWRERYPVLAGFVDRLGERESFKGTVPSPQTIKDKIV